MVLSYLSSYVYSTPSSSSSSAGSTDLATTTRRAQHSYTGKGKQRASYTDGEKEGEDPALGTLRYIASPRHSYYEILQIQKTFTSTDELRRAYMNRCRVCHPDKFPIEHSEEATRAFQRVSLAYETLSKPASRRQYDAQLALARSMGKDGYDESMGPHAHYGMRDPTSPDFGDETLFSVLRSMYCDFMDKGDFEMVRVLIEALNATNPGLNLGEETITGVESALRRMRGLLLSGAKHLRIVQFELMRLYEIQHDLRALSYFDVFGRLRLTLQLARVTLSIPMAIDKAMKEEVEQEANGDTSQNGEAGHCRGFVEEGDEAWQEGKDGRLVKRGLLGPRLLMVLGLAVAVLEKGERIM